MPVKSKARPKRRATSKKVSVSKEIAASKNQLSYCETSKNFWVIFSLILLAVGLVVVCAILFLFAKEQTRMVHDLQNVQKTVIGSQEQKNVNDAASTVKYHDSSVAGLHLAYSPCPPTFTGSCDDAMLFKRSADGSKQVIIPSLRSLKKSPQTTDILQPVAESPDHRWTVLRAWVFGGSQNPNDNRVWIYDSEVGDNIYYSDLVPQGAVFSPNYNLAAFITSADDELGRVDVFDLEENELISQITPRSGYSFMGPQGPTMYWESEDGLTIKEYGIIEPNSYTGNDRDRGIGF